MPTDTPRSHRAHHRSSILSRLDIVDRPALVSMGHPWIFSLSRGPMRPRRRGEKKHPLCLHVSRDKRWPNISRDNSASRRTMRQQYYNAYSPSRHADRQLFINTQLDGPRSMTSCSQIVGFPRPQGRFMYNYVLPAWHAVTCNHLLHSTLCVSRLFPSFGWAPAQPSCRYMSAHWTVPCH